MHVCVYIIDKCEKTHNAGWPRSFSPLLLTSKQASAQHRPAAYTQNRERLPPETATHTHTSIRHSSLTISSLSDTGVIEKGAGGEVACWLDEEDGMLAHG